MNENPYKSPQTDPEAKPRLAPEWQVLIARPRQKGVLLERPLGVSVICILQLLLIPLGAIFVLGSSLDTIIDNLKLLHIPPVTFLCFVLASWTLGMLSAIGLWSGAKWGWWCSTYYYVHAMLHTAFALAQVAMLTSRGVLTGGQVTFNVAWLAVRFPVLLPVFLYMFSDDVLAYVARGAERKGLTAIAIVAAALVVQAAELGMLFL